jgi:hypothetical protein
MAGHNRRTGVGVWGIGTKMATATTFGPGWGRAPAIAPAGVARRKPKLAAAIYNAEFGRTAPSGQANLYKRASRVETKIDLGSARDCLSAMHAGVASQYHYRWATFTGRKSENCCRNCGNLAPWISKVFCNPFINKHLYLFQIGPRLANCVAPAQVHLYWCPKSLSS